MKVASMRYVSGTYNIWLVALSFVVAILTAYTAVDLAARITKHRGFSRFAWLVGGAIAMGTGIWCMHFTGMRAYQLPIPVRYHIPTVVWSLLAAILASFSALYVVSRDLVTRRDTIFGSLLMGAGIAAMHYIGMAAMRMDAMHEYHPAIFGLSILLAIGISYAGITLLYHMRDENRGQSFKLLVAGVLGLAIPVMHYTGMAAISFRATGGQLNYAHSADISTLVNAAILQVTVVLLALASVTAVVDRRMSSQYQLLENERKMLRALIDHIPDRMYVKDLDGRFLLANSRLSNSLGLDDPRSLIGMTDGDFFPESLAKSYRDDELRLMSSGVSLLEKEESGVDAAGTLFPMLTTKVAIRDYSGRVTGIAGVGHDISERRKNEEALRKAESQYRNMFNDALVGIFKLDPEGHPLQVNPAMAEFLGYDSPEDMLSTITGPLWSRAASPEHHAEFLAEMMAAGSIRSYELEVLRKSGDKIWISSSIRTKTKDGVLLGFDGMFEDITERKTLRDQLLQAQKLESVGQLAAGLAHEINTPVQYIGDNVRFLKDTFEQLVALNGAYGRMFTAIQSNTLTPATLVDVQHVLSTVDVDYLFDEIPMAIEQTLEGISRVAELISAMKEFSHPGTGDKVSIDLNHAIESTITVSRNEWKYVADMNLDLDAGLPLVSCLPGEFNQVVLNLIVNAAHAIGEKAAQGGPQKGLISIKTQSMLGWVEIRVTDSGNGIPESARTRIFDPFFTTKEIGKGTGQGLAIARSVIVDKHDGAIHFETKEGVGTTFIIRLPCEAAQGSLPIQAAA